MVKAIVLVLVMDVQTTLVWLAMVTCYTLRPFSLKWFYVYLAHLLELWAQHLVFLIQYFAPCDLVITVDQSCTKWTKADGSSEDNGIEEVIRRKNNGSIETIAFPSRIAVMSNHQIYADWIYIWCIAHLANAHGSMKIILKDSLKKVPVAGWAMRMLDFIFLKRKLAEDQAIMVNNLERAKKTNIPMWLLLFPEGTVISHKTRKISKDYAEKMGYNDPKYVLLPRSTGLRICTNTLDDSVKYLYDFTVGYSGLKIGDVPEDVYTLRGILLFGHYPEKVHVHMRRFLIAEIPKGEEEYAAWLRDRWTEKDALMAEFYRTGAFPGEDKRVPIKVNTERVVDEDTGEVKVVRTDQDSSIYRSLEVPVKLKHTILDLTQVWFCLLPYVPIVKVIWAGAQIAWILLHQAEYNEKVSN